MFSNALSAISARIKTLLESAWKGLLKWFAADVLAVSSRHKGRRTKMLVSHSMSCCTEGTLVDLEWRSADCGAPWRRRPVHIAQQDTAVQSHVNTWTPADTAWRWCAVGCPASVDRRVEVASDHGQIFVCRWWLVPLILYRCDTTRQIVAPSLILAQNTSTKHQRITQL